MDAVRAEGVHRHRGAERGIDPARKPHDDAREAILVHIIAKPEDTGRVIGLIALLDGRAGSLDADKAMGAALPNRLCDHR